MIWMVDHARDGVTDELMGWYSQFSVGASACVECGDCVERCPFDVDILTKMRNLALEVKSCLTNNWSLDSFGHLLHQGWIIKRKLASSVSNVQIDRYYDQALHAGALGGKILGAGGGGFLLLCCPLEKQEKVREALSQLVPMAFSFEPEGSKIIYII